MDKDKVDKIMKPWTECFSCGIEFNVEGQNDRPEGYFCDKCIDHEY